MFKKGLIVVALMAAAIYFWYAFSPNSTEKNAKTSVTSQLGLIQQPCWFSSKEDWPAVNCYRMFVPENHQHGDRVISFPVIHFQQFSAQSTLPPMLHLGGGGPGGAMWIHNSAVVEMHWRNFENSVLRQGRDLYLIDPRGTGMAKPRLNCPSATLHNLNNLNNPKPIAEFAVAEQQLYIDCITELQQQGVEVSAYNSMSVIEDLKLLQQALAIDKWSLFGVSYGAVYALLYTNQAPEKVDTLILDSPAFPALKSLDDPVERFLSPMKQLENYCHFARDCDVPIENFSARFWQLIPQLDNNPIQLSLPSGFLGSPLPVKLTGELFLSILYYAVYGDDIYADIPRIVSELEQNELSTFYRYIDDYIELIKDQNFSGVSMISHLCYDEVPFVDHAKLTGALKDGLEGVMLEGALYTFGWPAAMCHAFGQRLPNKQMIKQTETSVPTLFLQGVLDMVTPLQDVQRQKPFFSQSQLMVYPLSHAVHGRLDCIDKDVSAFLAAPLATIEPAICTFPERD